MRAQRAAAASPAASGFRASAPADAPKAWWEGAEQAAEPQAAPPADVAKVTRPEVIFVEVSPGKAASKAGGRAWQPRPERPASPPRPPPPARVVRVRAPPREAPADGVKDLRAAYEARRREREALTVTASRGAAPEARRAPPAPRAAAQPAAVAPPRASPATRSAVAAAQKPTAAVNAAASSRPAAPRTGGNIGAAPPASPRVQAFAAAAVARRSAAAAAPAAPATPRRQALGHWRARWRRHAPPRSVACSRCSNGRAAPTAQLRRRKAAARTRSAAPRSRSVWQGACCSAAAPTRRPATRIRSCCAARRRCSGVHPRGGGACALRASFRRARARQKERWC